MLTDAEAEKVQSRAKFCDAREAYNSACTTVAGKFLPTEEMSLRYVVAGMR